MDKIRIAAPMVSCAQETILRNMSRIDTSVWLTAAEAARYLRVQTRTLLVWVREGSVKGYPLHGTKRHVWRFRREDLDQALGFVTATDPALVLDSSPPSAVHVQ